MTGRSWDEFPFDLLRASPLPGRRGELVQAVAPRAMTPPHPWGQWFYGDLLERQCSRLDGDVIEAGVGAGGMSIFLALTLKDLGVEKRVLAADSFQGLPEPHPGKDNPYFSRGEYDKEVGGGGGLESEVWLVAAGLGVGDMVVPVAGFFEDTLPHLDEQLRFCFIHVDADLYDSVLCAVECLYDRLVDGGMLAIDDFFHPGQGPARAAAEFFATRGLHPTYHVVFPYAAVVVKGTREGPRRSVDGNSYSFAWLRKDRVFVDAVAQSAKRAGGRARRNAELLLELLRTDTERRSDVYDYWRALEEFFEWADVLPEERVAHRL